MPVINRLSTSLFLVLAIAAFGLYSPLSYGNQWTKAECQTLKLFPTWDFDCNTFYDKYDDYVQASISAASANATSVPSVPSIETKIVAQEEKIEFRDQDGNILNEEQVAALEGKVDFETKYETKTRVVDEKGSEVPVPEGGWDGKIGGAGVAPPHPDVEGVDEKTVAKDSSAAKEAAASRDGEKEAEGSKAKPASEGKEATRKDEL